MAKSSSDVLMSIKPEHMRNIASGAKNHEYRGYLLPQKVHRIWFYTTLPVKQIAYVAHVSRGKIPGEVPENGGIGNTDFNEGRKKSKYGYEIIKLWMLKQPISLKKAILEGFLKGAPQKYCWVPVSLLRSYPLDEQVQLISNTPEELSVEGKKEASVKIRLENQHVTVNTDEGAVAGKQSESSMDVPS
ncbi:uncharacterized protein N7529_008672 [Penicillium soppii]|jgi:hypothetical protein|uniref:uncharacterized protein n=1 Tax=Penicillium soppii TaxID=69789 RepID=UPI002548633E|nr:uncharacterized protein N7529_008672 [Penicillium soppii]KAJ5861362.1 hypothetical protein N7529_008672 [Penicillium soppii]